MNIILSGNKPIFEQIVEQTKNYIDLLILPPDYKLPSVRSLALKLGINPNTVARAYEVLLSDEYIYSIDKKGNYVKKQENGVNKKKYILTKRAISILLETSQKEGLSTNELIKLIKETEEQRND